MIKRLQSCLLDRYLKKFPAVILLGARQVGKTTLVRRLLKTRRDYFTFDDEATIVVANESPGAFLTQSAKMTIDEAQKTPEIFPAIKKIIDEERIPGRFIITGSANISMLPKIKETLAGRAIYVEMDPLTVFEAVKEKDRVPRLIKMLGTDNHEKLWNYFNKLKPRKIQLEKLILRGGFPVAWLENNDDDRDAWFKSYVRSYLERDIRDISHVRNLHEFRKFLALAAFRAGQILSKSDLSRDAGIPFSTASQFFNLLMATFQIFTIEPYFSNIGKRIIKAPKLMWNDTGLALHLQGISSWVDVEKLGRAGHMLENKMAIELKVLLSVFMPWAKLFYWRTNAGAEVDFVISSKDRLIPIEVKWSEKIDHYDIRGMEQFLKDFHDRASYGIVLYKGKNLLRIKKNVFIVPLELVI